MHIKRQITATPWIVWQLAPDREAYGDKAGQYILATPSGEVEHPENRIYPTYEAAQQAANEANAWLRPLNSPELVETLDEAGYEGNESAWDMVSGICRTCGKHKDDCLCVDV